METCYQWHNDNMTKIDLYITHKELEQIISARTHFNPPAWTDNPIGNIIDAITNEIKDNTE